MIRGDYLRYLLKKVLIGFTRAIIRKIEYRRIKKRRRNKWVI